MNHPIKLVCVFGIAVLLNATAHAASKLYVANNGSDSGTCGTAINPCRSISRAISNAAPGDTIIVGPGHYGDLNGNRAFTDPGDESAKIGTGCSCMINVDKPLKIFSRDGADVTVLDAGTNPISVVTIQASNVIFGAKGKGFTITGSGIGFFGLAVLTATRVTVAGNRAVANDFGFLLSDGTSSNQLIGNVAVANHSPGFLIEGDHQTIAGNVAAANNGDGFDYGSTEGVVLFTRNVAVDNVSSGFGDDGASNPTVVITGNSAIGNRNVGIVANQVIAVTKNNIFGNQGASPVVNCGLFNDSNLGAAITAPNNFFGAATGPGPEPADDVCGGTITNTPFAKKEFKVKPISP